MSFLSIISKLLSTKFGVQQRMSAKNVIFITGCDSGLGYTLALFCHSLNMTVAAGCHNSNSEGAQNLLKLAKDKQRMHIVELDLTDKQTISNARQQIEDILAASQNNGEERRELTALVNNAGIMCFGEFEWQTWEQCTQQINVNLLGTWRITKELLPLVRRCQARIINITSHCGLNALPGVSSYAASKAALRYWNDALRIEMRQYGVKVINFVPGSFVMSSNIAVRQQHYAKEQLANLTEEQKIFYGDYFTRYHSYLSVLPCLKQVKTLNDVHLLDKFKHALTASQPRELYIHEPWRYKFYRLLFNIMPTFIADYLAVKFTATPTYAQVTKEINGKIIY